MLAKPIPSIIPRITFHEALEASAVHSVRGSLPGDNPFLTRRPFRSTHHTISTARKIQGERFKKTNGRYCNDQMTPREIEIYCALNQESRECIEESMRTMKLSARAYHRILKVARTIADLEGDPEISSGHLSEAANYRSLDRDYWGGF